MSIDTPYKIVLLAIAGCLAQTAGGATQDYTVQLDRFVSVTLNAVNFAVAIHDDGPKSIRVSFDHGNPVTFQKRDGFAPEDTETLLRSFGGSRLYYVNIISDRIGFCVLRIRSP